MELANINFKVNLSDKIAFEKIAEKIGANMSVLFNMFIKKTITENGLPFIVNLKNDRKNMYDKIVKNIKVEDEYRKLSEMLCLKQEDIDNAVEEYRKECK
jgi:DNA-damage-inducible protein J